MGECLNLSIGRTHSIRDQSGHQEKRLPQVELIQLLGMGKWDLERFSLVNLKKEPMDSESPARG